MRIYKFLKLASRAQQLSENVGPELLAAVKDLNQYDVENLFKGFVPLDFISLVRDQNPKAFNAALFNLIGRQLGTQRNQGWLEELKYTRDEAINEVFKSILNDDPKRRGVLNELLLDGSYSDAFQYTSKSEGDKRIDLRQSLSPISNTNAITVPHCPTDKALGIKHPLWSVGVLDGNIVIRRGVDGDGNCTQSQDLGPMSEEKFRAMKETGEGLTPEESKMIEDGKRKLEYEDGHAMLKCTFNTNLSKFQAFLSYQTQKAIKNVLDPERRRMGRGGGYWQQQMNRLKELEYKEKQPEGLTDEEKKEKKKIQKYLQKKELDFKTEQSMDVRVKGDEGEGKSLHDITEDKKLLDADEYAEEADSYRMELSRKFGDKEIHVLQEVAKVAPLIEIVDRISQIMELPARSPQKAELEKSVAQDTLKMSMKFLGGEEKNSNTCNTCGAELGTTATRCPHADQMKSVALTAYQDKESVSGIEEEVGKLSPEPKQHYTASGLSSVFNHQAVERRRAQGDAAPGLRPLRPEGGDQASQLRHP